MASEPGAADPRQSAYALLAAGSGTRMGPLTSDRAKVLVEVNGRAILDHNLRAIARVAPGAVVIVIAGYRAEAVATFVEGIKVDVRAEVLVNPDFAHSGPLRSVRIVLDRFANLSGTLAIGNGDTIFEPPALAALAAARSDIALLISDPDIAEPDAVQVRVEAGRILAAAKQLAAPGMLPVSAGLLQIRGERTILPVRRLVEQLIAEEERAGRSLTWHSLITALSEQGNAAVPVRIPPLWWCEFDSSDCIDRYLGRHTLGAKKDLKTAS